MVVTAVGMGGMWHLLGVTTNLGHAERVLSAGLIPLSNVLADKMGGGCPNELQSRSGWRVE